MVACLALITLTTYGAGTVLSRLGRLGLQSGPERFGISCALGAAALGWLGYIAAVARLPLIAVAATWAFAALGIGAMVRDWMRRQRPADPELTLRQWKVLLLAVAVGLAFAAGMQWGQIRYNADGSLAARFLWPDLLYRNALVARYLNFDGPPDWPWLAGEPLRGMSVLRFTALTPVLKALGISSDCYQVTALWLGLYGVPVAACAAFACFRALGASAGVSAVAVLLTAFCGGPRWLLNDRFAHSPALHWAGSDVFAVAVPVLLALLALVVIAARERRVGLLGLAMFLLVSGPGFVPWLGLSVYAGLPLALLVALVRRRDVGAVAVLAAGALLGLVVLRVLMGTGASGGGSALAAVAPSEAVRHLNWAIPFLAEPLRPLLASPTPTNVMKLAKFAAVFPWAVLVFLLGSLWVRAVVLLDARNWRWGLLQQTEYSVVASWVVAGVLLSTIVDFRRLAYDFAGYDALRILWPALLVANLGVATLAARHREWLHARWGPVVLALFVFYGAWENTQLVLWTRTGLEWAVVPAPQMACLRYLRDHSGSNDIVLITPTAVTARDGLPPGEVPAQHAWGYVSGLLDARVYLDNHDMAAKFGQGPIWQQREQALADVRAGHSPEAAEGFLRAQGVRWVLVEDDPRWADRLAAAGCRLMFRDGGCEVYERAAAATGR